MLVESRNIISGEPLYVIKNNSMEAVLLPFEVYENLHSLEELLEKDYKANIETVNFKAFKIMLWLYMSSWISFPAAGVAA